MKKRFTLRDAAFVIAAVVFATVLSVALTPSPYANAATKLVTTTEETGSYVSSVDASGTKTATVTVTATGKVIRWVAYATNNDFDVINGTDYWSYRVVNGVVTAQYRIGTVAGTITGRVGQKLGTYEFYSGNVLAERHYVGFGTWTREFYLTNGQVDETISRVLTVNGQYGTVTSTSIKDYVAPSPAPTATTAPTFVPPASPTPTATTQPTTPPAPTQDPSVSPSPAPTQDPTPEEVSNYTSLKHSTKAEKKAYSTLGTLESLAKSYGWEEKRTYTRKSSSSKKVVTDVYYKGDFGGDKYVTFKFSQVVKKTGKKYVVSYYQGSKKVSSSGVKKVIKRIIR